jgi:hypothetical protein
MEMVGNLPSFGWIFRAAFTVGLGLLLVAVISVVLMAILHVILDDK